MKDLDAQLLAAQACGDKSALVMLYASAADQAGSVDAACFYLTHAYIFALELGHADIAGLHARLSEHGRV
jgi:hypothetical protein